MQHEAQGIGAAVFISGRQEYGIGHTERREIHRDLAEFYSRIRHVRTVANFVHSGQGLGRFPTGFLARIGGNDALENNTFGAEKYRSRGSFLVKLCPVSF